VKIVYDGEPARLFLCYQFAQSQYALSFQAMSLYYDYPSKNQKVREGIKTAAARQSLSIHYAFEIRVDQINNFFLRLGIFKLFLTKEKRGMNPIP
jgi:hypothetical protein